MKKLFLLIVPILMISCYSKDDLDKSYSDGYNVGLEEGKKVSASQLQNKYNQGHRVGFDEGVDKGRLDAFLDLTWAGLKAIAPSEAIKGGAYGIMFIAFLFVARSISPIVDKEVVDRVKVFRLSLIHI